MLGVIVTWLTNHGGYRYRPRRRYTVLGRIPAQMMNMHALVTASDEDCRDQLRMDRGSFQKLCYLVRSIGGLKSSRNVSVEEKVAIFLSILSHHTKNRFVKFQFKRSGQTVSKHFNHVLNCILRMHCNFLVQAQPIDEDSSDARWGPFQGCLSALDGTYIDVHIPTTDKGRYRNRKGQVTVNVLGVCDINMLFVYVLTGWEGSAADSCVLRDAIHRTIGLHVPRGNYYLCDNGYPNCEGFLTPYKGVRYHLSEWSSRQPQTYEEYFNMKHTRARNVI
ncbi:hypothetical protein ACS0TY_016713 [Phlomoides rotata]